MCTCSEGVTRRDAIKFVAGAAAALAVTGFPLGWARAQDAKAKKILFYTRSQGFQHDVIKRPDNNSDEQLSLAEKTFVDLGKQHGFEVTATKDGSIFTPEKLAEFDAIAFYTTGNLLEGGGDGTPPMPAGGKEALLKFIEDGKGFMGMHCASDTFHGGENENADPYIKMLGGEFDGHGGQQNSKIRAVPGFGPLAEVGDFEVVEEWYVFRNIAPDMQVLLVQETDSMQEDMYKKDRKPYPMTWARKQGNGKVFYTSMGHRDDVWTNEIYHKILLGGLSWIVGNAEAEIKPNLKEACPEVQKVREGTA